MTEEKPKLFDQVKSLAAASIAVVKIGKIRATPEEHERRYGICKACPFLSTTTENVFGKVDGKERCTKCGCNMITKTAIHVATCPEKKW